MINARVSGGSSDVSIFIGYGQSSDIRNVSSNGVIDSLAIGAGGLLGDGVFTNVVNSYATGSVSGTSSVGGLIGFGEDANVDNSYAIGSVSGSGNIGGLIGDGQHANVLNSYATGSVSGDATLGGLIGHGGNATVVNSYATGSVSGTNRVGGLIGSIGADGATISSSYWDTRSTSQTNSSGGGLGKTTNELQSPISFTGSIYGKLDESHVRRRHRCLGPRHGLISGADLHTRRGCSAALRHFYAGGGCRRELLPSCIGFLCGGKVL